MELAIDDPIKRAQQYAVNQNQFQAPQAPLSQDPGVGTQMANMAKNRAMQGALNTGQKELMGAIAGPSAGATNAAALAANPATMGMGGAEVALAGQTLAPSVAGAGGMAALGTAIPYVGAGLLAGKALGLFNEGGMVGPLSAQYHAEGTMNTPKMKGLRDHLSYMEYIKSLDPDLIVPGEEAYYEMDLIRRGDEDLLKFKSEGGPINPEYKANEMLKDQKMLQKIINIKQSDLDPSKIGSARGGMTTEQAMALMNNQPDPDELYNEIVAESMIGKTQQGQAIPSPPKAMTTINQMPQYQTMQPIQKVMPLVGPLSVDSLGADTTYSDEMYKPINT